ncbi:DUF2243 domain-containing protein [Streptomyces sp. DH8]|uniref:DUF2243 domain-containing protein n=1 Tax=Streptomyces sp. DH8 TaxID=2857008 RepID=UPI001E57D898|nr:DUF2243 domain-containing protein [Streptomyces sp. DH8]
MNASVHRRPGRPAPSATRRSLVVCGMIGAAVMAAVDEIVFHQILGWHHFYDRSTSSVGLLSDGLLHTAELLALIAGLFLYADLRRSRTLAPAYGWAGFFLGLGAFQLFDGIVDHKLLRLHQIRYGVDITPYDWAWNAGGLALLLTGLVLGLRARRSGRPGPAS